MSKNIEIIGNYGATLSLIEVGLGSLLHAFKVPFAGIFLSLNQGYLLCRASLVSSEKWNPYAISNIAAVLKSLSPAGQKLGPMLSLSMQGLLFNLGTVFLGINPFGLGLGMVFLSVWSFIQPLITYYLFFGEKLFNAAQFLYSKTFPYHGIKSEYLWAIFLVLVALKALTGVILALIAWKTKGEAFNQDKLVRFQRNKENTQKSGPFVLALKDLLRPLFLSSFILTGAFLYFSSHEMAQIIWYLMRPLAIGFIFFYFSRSLTLDRWLDRLEGGRFDGFSKGCRIALSKLRNVL